MKRSELIFLICIFINWSISIQGCDLTSDSTQCSWGQICSDSTCVQATRCKTDEECTTSGKKCVTGYCQTPTCGARGQCVYGQICSQYDGGTCLYPVDLKAPEGTEFLLTFPAPALLGKKFKSIEWMKEDRKIALYDGNSLIYFNEYCETTPTCRASRKGHLNSTTGELTISNTSLSDEGGYYFRFLVDGDPDFDGKVSYEVNVEVFVEPQEQDMLLVCDPPDMYPNQEVICTCIIPRIKPEAQAILWGGNFQEPEIGTVTTIQNPDSTVNQSSVHKFKFNRSENGRHFWCSVMPVYGNSKAKPKRIEMKPRATENPSSTVKPGFDNKTSAPDNEVVDYNQSCPEVHLLIDVFLAANTK